MRAIDLIEPGALFRGALFADLVQSALDLQPGARLGVFRVVRELGRGGMGVVYLGERDDGQYRQRVALKAVGGARVGDEVFRRERQILADLRHPHIARLVDGGQDAQGRPWLALELIEGRRLDEHCIDGALPVAERLRLFLAVCDAVQFAHGRGVLHRDLKPSNVMVDADGSAKLLDFGIAELIGSGSAAPQAFTPGYASPEQLAGESLTAASDIYQLGVLLGALLVTTRERPGLAPARREPAAYVDADLAAIIGRATAARPEARYASAAALADDLRAHLAHRPVSARPRHAGYLLQRFVQRHPFGVSLGLATFALIVAGVAAFTWRLGAERDLSRFEARRAEAVSAFLFDLFRDGDPTRSIDPNLTARELVQAGARRLQEDTGLPPDVHAELAAMLAEIQIRLGDHVQARALIEAIDAERLAPARLHLLRGRLAQGSGATGDALVELAAALTLAPDPEVELLLARAESDAGQTAESNRRIDALLSRRGELPPGVQLGLLGSAGIAQWRAGHPQQAIDRYREALALIPQVGIPSSPAPLHLNMALALIDLAQFDEALAELAAAEQALARFPNLGYRLRVLQQRGIIHFRRSDWDAARREWEQMRAESAGGMHPGLHATALHNLATTYEDEGRAERVLDYSLQAARARDALGDKPGALSSRINAATKYADLGRGDIGLAMAEPCLAQARAMQRPDLALRALVARAIAQRQLGQSAAFASLDEALALTGSDANRVKRFDAHLQRIIAALWLGDRAQLAQGLADYARDSAGIDEPALVERGNQLARLADIDAVSPAEIAALPQLVRRALARDWLRNGRTEDAVGVWRGLPEEPNFAHWTLTREVAASMGDAALATRAQSALAELSASAERLRAEDQAGGPQLPANR